MKNLTGILILVAVISLLAWYYYSTFQDMEKWTPEQQDAWEQGADQQGSGPYRY